MRFHRHFALPPGVLFLPEPHLPHLVPPLPNPPPTCLFLLWKRLNSVGWVETAGLPSSMRTQYSGEALAAVSRAQDAPETVHRMLGACVYFSDKKALSLGQTLQVSEVQEMLGTCGSDDHQGWPWRKPWERS